MLTPSPDEAHCLYWSRTYETVASFLSIRFGFDQVLMPRNWAGVL